LRTFVTGATGQDGAYLAELLSERGDEVWGLYRGQEESRLNGLRNGPVKWVRGDVTDSASIQDAVQQIKPDYVFNLAAASYVGLSWQMPKLYMETNCGGVLNVLEAVRRFAPEAHVIQASTSEMYGNEGGAHNENSKMIPASPYGVSKLAAHHLCRIYRESYEMRVSCAISFNHESPRRPPIFVSRKVAQAAARIRAGHDETLTLGNLNIWRDWGFAGDFVEAYALMAEQNKGDDYVVATGVAHSLSELVRVAFKHAGVESRVEVRPGDRPVDVYSLCGDPRKIEKKLGWRAKTSFDSLIKMMVESDLEKEMVAV